MSFVSVFASATTHRELVLNLIVRDIKTRYKQSVLGYAWAFLNPLVWAMIYWLVFGIFLKQDDPGVPFFLFIYFGLLFWNLFVTGLVTATEGLVSHLGLITKVYFPREVFPVSSVLSKLVDFGFGLCGLVPILLITRVVPNAAGVLLMLPVLFMVLVFTTGLGLLAACANLFYRDIRYLVQLALGLMGFLVPNAYPLEKVTNAAPWMYRLYLLNPMAVFIEVARRLVLPSTGPLAPLIPYLIVACGTSVVSLVVGFVVFKRYEARFAESI